MNKEDLAKRAGVSAATVTRIERGKTGKSPHSHPSTLLLLAEALDVHPDELLVKR